LAGGISIDCADSPDNQRDIIFSEDFSDGQKLVGVRFVNPFSDEFWLEAWA